jgi:hypothetical protein
MACLVCGEPLDDDGSCPHCGAGSDPPSAPDIDAGRERAHLESPPGGAVLPGRADRLGVFQATGQRTNWFVRIAVLIAVMVFGIAILGIVGAGLVAALTGIWLLPHGGALTIIGILVMVVSLLALAAIGAMFWLLVRGDSR